jgi:hypothetical protein
MHVSSPPKRIGFDKYGVLVAFASSRKRKWSIKGSSFSENILAGFYP